MMDASGSSPERQTSALERRARFLGWVRFPVGDWLSGYYRMVVKYDAGTYVSVPHLFDREPEFSTEEDALEHALLLREVALS